MYRPSYISLHTALAFYGLIQEAVPQVTSVTSLKTARFENDFAVYSYKSVRADLMFGYTLHELDAQRAFAFATREKALLNLLYLYPSYDTEAAMRELRLDENTLHDDVDLAVLGEQLTRFHCKSLAARVGLMKEVYDL